MDPDNVGPIDIDKWRELYGSNPRLSRFASPELTIWQGWDEPFGGFGLKCHAKQYERSARTLDSHNP